MGSSWLLLVAVGVVLVCSLSSAGCNMLYKGVSLSLQRHLHTLSAGIPLWWVAGVSFHFWWCCCLLTTGWLVSLVLVATITCSLQTAWWFSLFLHWLLVLGSDGIQHISSSRLGVCLESCCHCCLLLHRELCIYHCQGRKRLWWNQGSWLDCQCNQPSSLLVVLAGCFLQKVPLPCRMFGRCSLIQCCLLNLCCRSAIMVWFVDQVWDCSGSWQLQSWGHGHQYWNTLLCTLHECSSGTALLLLAVLVPHGLWHSCPSISINCCCVILYIICSIWLSFPDIHFLDVMALPHCHNKVSSWVALVSSWWTLPFAALAVASV